MSGLVLVLRPEPGASATADRARRHGLDPVVAPLFTVCPLAWRMPEAAGFDAVLLTSANAARQGGPQLRPFLELPCHAVGEATADAARAAGFRDVRAGAADGAAALAEVEGGRVLHFCGREHVALERPGVAVERRAVYAADAVDVLPPEAAEALGRGAAALIHSPRAGALFARLVDGAGPARGSVAIAALSGAAAMAAGTGWRSVRWAERPSDEALLELARRLCQTEAGRVRE
jgi:uroporphyrinogen-III synthase